MEKILNDNFYKIMKNQLFFYLTSFILSACISDNKISTDLINNPITGSNKNNVDVPYIEMKEDYYDFGDIFEGEIVSHNFSIKNIGDEKLIILSAKGSCGCTVPEWPKEPISPNQKAFIKVTFNSSGRQGKQRKTVVLKTNSIPNIKVITILANVITS